MKTLFFNKKTKVVQSQFLQCVNVCQFIFKDYLIFTVQSQYKEIESDLMKLKDDMEKMRSENEDEKSQHVQEFQTLKQEKENEITACKGMCN